ncbi:hypothetical protein COY27_06445 [Candidatus Woesearchaeota archaeon CG_4_10_14_0_2_um_filter_33_13]|nr:MAG: hypothetical protein COY27_06445 [Candidatus Woesearchaeota archaeon CG_4_10_14_0_2_um_filter_33_13]
MKNKNFVDLVKEAPLYDKLLYGGAIATILGFFLPFVAGIGGMAIKIPYVWILFLVSLAVPGIKVFMEESNIKRDLLITLSELLAVTGVVGLLIMTKFSGILGGAVGLFDMLNVGSVFLIIGSITLFVGALKQKY